ncbi:GatB/YqeY domain-containing protein [Nitriliruptoraceae bacterium ZYF776]|nr:GatB/YqeY domain-containing protein [Profundirhabdus halotolerans]
MATLHDRIETDLREAMKARDKARTSALRMVVAALKNRATADGLSPQGRLDDEVVEKVLATEVKRRKEAAAAYAEAGRDQQAAGEEAEAAVYATYLPEPLSEAELEAAVDAAIAEVGATGPQDLGKVMKTTMASLGGRADGARVSALAKAKLVG